MSELSRRSFLAGVPATLGLLFTGKLLVPDSEYAPKVWKTEDMLSADELNRMERGIQEALRK